MSNNSCAVDSCERNKYCKGWCTRHYQRFLKYGDPEAQAPSRARLATDGERSCCESACARPVKARGMCKAHYEVWLNSVSQSERSPGVFEQNRLKSLSREEVSEAILSVPNGSQQELAKAFGVKRQQIRTFLANNPWAEALTRAQRESYYAPEKVAARETAARECWRVNNPDVVREINRRWAKNQSPEKRKIWNHYNRVQRATAKAVKLTDEAVDYLSIIANDPCVFCGSQERITTDHIIPVVRGGSNDWDNFAPACHSCNASKGSRSLLTHLAKKYSL